MDNIVAVLLEVEILDDGSLDLGLLGGVAVDADFEFTPAFVGAGKRGLVKCYLVKACISDHEARPGLGGNQNLLCTGFSKVGCRL